MTSTLSIEEQRGGLIRTSQNLDQLDAPKREIQTRSKNLVLENTLMNDFPRKKKKQVKNQNPINESSSQSEPNTQQFHYPPMHSFGFTSGHKPNSSTFQVPLKTDLKNCVQIPNPERIEQAQNHSAETWHNNPHLQPLNNRDPDHQKVTVHQRQNNHCDYRAEIVHFKNMYPLDFIELKEARKRAFILTTNNDCLIKFMPEIETIGYFLVGRLIHFVESARLVKISLIEPWIHRTLPSIPAIHLKQSKTRAQANLPDDAIDIFLVRLARLLHGKSKPHSKVALTKTKEENTSCYAQRLIIEFDTVMKLSFDEIRSESDVVSAVFFYMTCNESDAVRMQLNQALTYGSFGNIDKIEKLVKLTDNVDRILVIQNTQWS